MSVDCYIFSSDGVIKLEDIELIEDQIQQMKHSRSKRLVANEVRKWPNGCIPYIIYQSYFTGKLPNFDTRFSGVTQNSIKVIFHETVLSKYYH